VEGTQRHIVPQAGAPGIVQQPVEFADGIVIDDGQVIADFDRGILFGQVKNRPDRGNHRLRSIPHHNRNILASLTAQQREVIPALFQGHGQRRRTSNGNLHRIFPARENAPGERLVFKQIVRNRQLQMRPGLPLQDDPVNQQRQALVGISEPEFTGRRRQSKFAPDIFQQLTPGIMSAIKMGDTGQDAAVAVTDFQSQLPHGRNLMTAIDTTHPEGLVLFVKVLLATAQLSLQMQQNLAAGPSLGRRQFRDKLQRLLRI